MKFRPPASLWAFPWCPRVRGAPGTSRPTMRADVARWAGCRGAWDVCGHGAGDGTDMVGADVPGGPRGRGVFVGVFGGVPWARRAEDVAPYHVCGHGAGWHGVVRGRGGRPRPPVWPWRLRGRLRWARRAEDVAPYHVYGHGGYGIVRDVCGMVRCVVGADVPGRPRPCGRSRGVFMGVPVGECERTRRSASLPFLSSQNYSAS